MCLCFTNVFRFSTESLCTFCASVRQWKLASGEGDMRVSGAFPALPGAEWVARHYPFGRKWSSPSASPALFWGGGPSQGNGHMHGHMWVGHSLLSAHNRALVRLNLGHDVVDKFRALEDTHWCDLKICPNSEYAWHLC